MKGFDLEFKDIPDYISKISHRIWEKRGIDLIFGYYCDRVVTHYPNHKVYGTDGIVQEAIDSLSLFPDRKLLSEDIIWSGTSDLGFLSSHRIISTATHLGDGLFGKATGRPMQFRTIADCFCHENQIKEEWVITDQAAIIDQCGLNLDEVAFEMAKGKVNTHLDVWERLHEGNHRPVLHQAHPAAKLVREVMFAVYNKKNLSVVDQIYHEAANLHLPSHRFDFGKMGVERYFIKELAKLVDSKLFIDHSIALEEAGQAIRVATRWRRIGIHPDTRARVLVMGITHTEVIKGKITREWQLIDELAVRMQGFMKG